ncbi:acyltransferase family protein [Photobacterium profundum 3TCK]|uniref:Acyltransferase family protein n=3 Tax=Photobacterium profundum TaxID=74109 RepID=Q1Z872_9GAMM|nr:acyltransferase family protein [Photobacterium profundum 3TCK]
MIVALHGGFLKDTSPDLAYFINNGLFRIAVPIFFIISGFFYFSMNHQKKIKWSKKLATIYMTWSVIYSYFWFDFSHPISVRNFLYVINGYHHLWFVPALLYSAFFVVFINKFRVNKFVTIFLLFSMGFILQHAVFNDYIDIDNVNGFNQLYLYRNFLFFGLPFFILGNVLAEYEVFFRKIKPLVLPMLIVSFIIMLIETYFNYKLYGDVVGVDILLSLLILCPFIFLFVLMGNSINTEVFLNLAQLSSAIYFIHQFVLIVVRKTFIFDESMISLIAIFISAVVGVIIVKVNKIVKILI